jgi:CubicO group peptidase (beta-lactamase class C family)
MMKLKSAALLMLIVACHASAQATRDTGPIEAARSKLSAVLSEQKVPGAAIAVTVAGQTVLNEAYGFSNIESKAAATTQTKFGLGSVSKSLTMVLAFRLAEKGLLDLDAPIEKYLKDYPYKGRGITVRLIGTHLSGYADEFDDRYFYNSRRFDSTDDVLREFFKEAPKFAAGERSVYGTTTFTLVAGVIESVTKKPYFEALREYVLEPLKMKSVEVNDRRRIIEGRTSFYIAGPDKIIQNGEFVDPSFKVAGAGLLSNAEDLSKFGASLTRAGFLSDNSLRQLFAPAMTKGGEQTVFAPGFRVVRDGEREFIFQPGGGVGVSSILYIDRKRGISLAIVTNLTGAPVGGLGFLRSIADAF